MAEIAGGDILFRLLADPSEFDEALDGALSRLEEASEVAEEAGGSLGEGLGGGAVKANSALQGLSRGGISGVASAVRVVNPELGKALQVFGGLQKGIPKLAGSLKALPAALGPIGIAAIAAGAAFAALTAHTNALGRELDQLEADLAAHGDRVNKAGQITDSLDEKHKALTDQLAILRGEVTANEVALSDFNEEIDRSVEEQINLLGVSGQAAEDIRKRGEGIKKLRSEVILETEAQEDLAEGLRQAAEAARDADEAYKQYLQGLKVQQGLEDIFIDQALQLKVLNGEMTSAEKQIADFARGIRAQVEAQIQLMGLEGEAAEEARRNGERLIEQKEEILRTQAQILKREERIEKAAAERAEIAAEAAAAQAEIAAQQAADQEAIYGGINDTLSGVGDLSATVSQQIAEDNREAALALYRTSQAAALSQIAINTAVAITKALAELGPVAGAVAAGGIGITGAAQAAAVLAQPPPAHMGDPDAPDEARTPSGRKVLAGEAVLDAATYRRLGGQEGLRNLQRSGALGGQNLTINMTYKNLDREIARQARATGRVSRTLSRSASRGKARGGW